MKTDNHTILAARVGDSVPSATSCSHLIYKAYKYRIYPNAEQRRLLAKHFGCCRYIYNFFLDRRDKAYKDGGKNLTYCGTAGELVNLKKQEETKWLAEVYSHTLQAELRNLDIAYRNFFRKKGKHPRFHGKHDRQSCMFPDNVKVRDGSLILPKFKTPIKMEMHRPLEGKVCHAVVSRDCIGKYYVSILCEEECAYLPETSSEIGIDL